LNSSNTTSELRPGTAAEAAAILHERCLAHGPGVWIVGGGTSVSRSLPGERLSTAGLARVIDYPARDMTVTVESGVRVADLRQELAAFSQRLPIDVPDAHRATVGGAVACNVSGPGRFALGTLRDYVIGIRAIDGQGRQFAAGGRVVKNVAGYDLCKLLVGSRGTLAVITELTFKLRPQPEDLAWVRVSLDDWDSLERILANLRTSATRPVAVEVINRIAARELEQPTQFILGDAAATLLVAFEGTTAEVAWQVDELRRELSTAVAGPMEVIRGGEAVRLWTGLTEWSVSGELQMRFDAAVLPSHAVAFLARLSQLGCAVVSRAANGVVAGRLPPVESAGADAASIREQVRQAAKGGGGWAYWCDGWATTMSSAAPLTTRSIDRSLKHTFDPQGILNPGLVFP
jgi:glycolate oxidase FAD binding subunit